MELESKTMKQLYSSNDSNKTTEVAMAAAQTTLGGDISNDSNGGGVNMDWLGSSGNTDRRKQNQQQEGINSSNSGSADLNQRQWQCQWQAVRTWRDYSGLTRWQWRRGEIYGGSDG